MLTERHSQESFYWPKGYRTAVTMTFDFQGGEDVRPLPDGSMDHEEYTQCEYLFQYGSETCVILPCRYGGETPRALDAGGLRANKSPQVQPTDQLHPVRESSSSDPARGQRCGALTLHENPPRSKGYKKIFLGIFFGGIPNRKRSRPFTRARHALEMGDRTAPAARQCQVITP